MSLTNSPRIFITGVLGGIGFNTAQYLLPSNIPIRGVDNFHPLSAPIVHHQHQLSILLKNPNFTFHALDVRRIKDLISLIQQFNPTHLIHLAGISISYPAFQSAKDILADYLEVMRDVAAFAIESGIVLFRIGYRKPDSSVQAGETGEPLKTLSWIENQVDQFIIEHNSDLIITTINLPALIGLGQSPSSFPLKQLWQLASMVSPQIPLYPETAECLGLSAVAKHLGDLILDISPTDHSTYQSCTRNFIQREVHRVRTLDVFRRFLPYFPQKVEIIEIQESWAYQSNDDIYSVDDQWLSAQVEEIYRWLIRLPHFPPTEWYIKSKDRRHNKPIF